MAKADRSGLGHIHGTGVLSVGESARASRVRAASGQGSRHGWLWVGIGYPVLQSGRQSRCGANHRLVVRRRRPSICPPRSTPLAHAAADGATPRSNCHAHRPAPVGSVSRPGTRMAHPTGPGSGARSVFAYGRGSGPPRRASPARGGAALALPRPAPHPRAHVGATGGLRPALVTVVATILYASGSTPPSPAATALCAASCGEPAGRRGRRAAHGARGGPHARPEARGAPRGDPGRRGSTRPAVRFPRAGLPHPDLQRVEAAFRDLTRLI